MRRVFVVAAVVVTAVLGSPALAQTREVIHSYDVAIEIRADDSIRITEVIAYDFGSTAHHGIFRDVPTREAYDDRYDRVFPLHVESVEATGGASADYEVSQEPGGITRIKIGDPDETVTGPHTYTIVYTVEAAMNGFRDHDELYWNAIGEDWEVPVEEATATVSAPSAIVDSTCYAGSIGSTASCDKERILEDGTARFRQSDLFPFEAFTVVVSLPKGVVAEPQPRLVEPWSIGRAFSRTSATLGLSGGLLVAAGGGLRLAALDPRPRPPLRGLADRPDHGERDRRRAGRAAVRAGRRARRVRSARGPPAGADRHDRGRAGEHARRHRDDRGPGRPRLPDDRGDPEGGVVRQAGLDAASHGQGRRRSPHVRTDAPDRAVRGRQRPHAVQPAAHVLRTAGQGRGPALRRRREAWVVREATRQGPGVVARARSVVVRRRPRAHVRPGQVDHVRARGHPGDRRRGRPHGRRPMDARAGRRRARRSPGASADSAP